VLLSKALRIAAGTTIAFTGAGGKSGALRRLAGEASPDIPVLLTTTTHLGLEQADLAVSHIVLTEQPDMGRVREELGRTGSLLVTGRHMEDESRWTSPGEANLTLLHDLAQQAGAVLVIEADGARGKGLKAPADHEPLVPNFTNTLVPVVGASVFGSPLTADWVHRPEVVARVLGEPQEVDLTPERVARLIGSSDGGLKGRPAGAEVRVLINQVDDSARRESALDCARRLLSTSDVNSVILASLSDTEPVQQVVGQTAGVILAAGGSKRLGRPKLLEHWKGEPLVRFAVQAALEGGLAPVVVVLGDHAHEVRRVIEDLPVRSLVNERWEVGQSSSMRLGLAAIRAQAEAVMFLLGDMPLVEPELVRSIVGTHASSLAPIVLPHAAGQRGNPVLFDRSTFDALAQVEGDKGGRAIFNQFEPQIVEADAREFFDLDTQQDLNWLEDQS
jgi:molybdenum cofactor cytidylyltransferase